MKTLFQKSFHQLIHRFPPATFKIFKDESAQSVERSKEGLAIIGLGKFRYKPLQVRIAGDHKSGDRYF